MRSLYPKGKEPGLLDPGSFYPLIPSGFTRMTLLGYSVNRGAYKSRVIPKSTTSTLDSFVIWEHRNDVG